MDTATKTGPDAAKNAFKKVVHKTAETIQELKGNKIPDKIVKPKHVPEGNLRNVAEIVIPPEKRLEILNTIGKYYKTKHYKISKLLNNSTVSNFVIRKQNQVKDLLGGQYSVNKNIRFKI